MKLTENYFSKLMIYKSYLLEKDISLLKNHVTLFYGENLGLKNDFKSLVKEYYLKSEFIAFHQDEILKNENLFFNEVNNISLFNTSKILFIDQVNDKILHLIDQLETQNENQKIFLFAELLDKKSKLRSVFEKSNSLDIVPCYTDNEITLKKIIQDRLKGYEGLSGQVINTILESCMNDRAKLKDELNKIITFFKNKAIKINELELLLNIRENSNFDLLKDQALMGNKLLTNKLISDTVLEPEKSAMYLALINLRLKKLLEADEMKKNENIENIIDKIKPPIFWKDKTNFLLQAQKWNKKKVQIMLNNSYDYEIRIKSNSQINQSIMIKKFLIDICNLANA